MAYKITAPGIYLDVPANDYHSDPTPQPSLSQSLAKVIIAKSPWHAWTMHPRLNPAYEASNHKKFDVGNCAHSILLGRGKEIAVINAADYRTKLAQEARDDAIAAGKSPVLEYQFDLASEMADAARQQLVDRFGLGHLFAPDKGNSEVVLAWEENGIWLRTMIDWLSNDLRTLVDLKTTIASAAPQALSMKMAQDGWCLQAAMHERGLDTLDKGGWGRRDHLFICQEAVAPFAISVSLIREAPRTMGRKQLAFAIEQWREAITTDKWPGYDGIQEPEYPTFLESRWLEREIAAQDNEQTVLAAG